MAILMSSAANVSNEIAAKPRIRAAQYVRMSTEHQKYSTENQAEIIAVYAATRGMEIVSTYADEGKIPTLGGLHVVSACFTPAHRFTPTRLTTRTNHERTNPEHHFWGELPCIG
jgi:hypothetical protein